MLGDIFWACRENESSDGGRCIPLQSRSDNMSPRQTLYSMKNCQERDMHKKVRHVITICTKFITKIHIFVSTVSIPVLCALWGCSQEEKLHNVQSRSLCISKVGFPGSQDGYWGAPLLLAWDHTLLVPTAALGTLCAPSSWRTVVDSFAYEPSDLLRPLFLWRQISPKEYFLSIEDKGRVDILRYIFGADICLVCNWRPAKNPKKPLWTAASGLTNYSPEPSQWRSQVPAGRICWSLQWYTKTKPPSRVRENGSAAAPVDRHCSAGTSRAFSCKLWHSAAVQCCWEQH